MQPQPTPASDRTPPRRLDGSPVPVPHHRVAIVGAGFGGIGMAIRLLQRGERDFVVLEKASEVGGTWRDNTYPGCQCDVASNIYSFSFAPNPEWSRAFAWQGEIFAYLKGCAHRFGVRPFVRFGHAVQQARWQNEQQRWAIETSAGALTADVLVLGHGGLSAPSVPDIAGLDRFEGTLFHSAQWRHDHDLRGERVAVIGTGASAIQVVPAIQPEVGRLLVFQRTPAWVVPRVDPEVGKRTRALYRRVPLLQKLSRLRQYLGRELVLIAFLRPWLMRAVMQQARQYLREQVPDPALRKKLTPRYMFGCKRVLLSNDYYPALCQPNVELVTEHVREITADGLITADGRHHPVDTIVLCTGFKVTDHPMTERVRGRDGRSLREHWQNGPSAYLGTTVTGFPNLFVLAGPYTGLGHNSIIYMLESQFAYVLDALELLRTREAAVLEVRKEAQDAFCAQMQRKLEGTVWSTGCASWYLTPGGLNTTLWPDFTFRFRARTRKLDPRAYTFEPERAQVAPEAGAARAARAP